MTAPDRYRATGTRFVGVEDDIPTGPHASAITMACRFAFAKRIHLLTQIADGVLVRTAQLVNREGNVVTMTVEPTIDERMKAMKLLAEYGRVDEPMPGEMLPEELQEFLPPDPTPVPQPGWNTPLALIGGSVEEPRQPASPPSPFGVPDAFGRVVERLEAAASLLSGRGGAAPDVAGDGETGADHPS